MDENTRFLMGYISDMETRIREDIKVLRLELQDIQAFKNKLLGMALVAGGAAGLVVEVILKST